MKSREERNEQARRWYCKNREKVRARHRERIESEPEYRDRKREIQRRAYAKRMASRPPTAPKNASREINGVNVQTFTVRETARLLDIGESTLNCWMMRGNIPEPLFTEPILFTRTQLYLMRKLKMAGLNRKARKKAKKAIFKDWNWH